MRRSPPGSGVPPPRGLPRGGGTPYPSDPGEIPILDTDPDPGSVIHRQTPGLQPCTVQRLHPLCTLTACRASVRLSRLLIGEFPRGVPGGPDCSPKFFARVFPGRRVRLSEFRLFSNKRGLPGFSHFFSREKRAGGPLRDGAGRGSTPKYCYELDIRFFRDVKLQKNSAGPCL